MIDQRIIEEVLTDQKDELDRKTKRNWVEREEESLVDIDSSLAQVVIGVRRSGKSTLCYNIIRKSRKKFAYLNFDDDRLINADSEDLNTMYKVLLKIDGEFRYLFIDEAQNIEGWHLFVNRLLRSDIHVLLTGSNAKLLSSELATHLTGRHSTIPLFPFPFSFRNFCHWNKFTNIDSHASVDEARMSKLFDEYMQEGGFPETFSLNNKRQYVNELYNNIVQRDIKQRYKLRYSATFERLAEHIMNTCPTKIVYSSLKELFNIKSSHTAENYISYLRNTYLINTVRKFSRKSRLRIRNEKAYAVDVSFMNQRANALSGDNLGWRLETAVCTELHRRYLPKGYDVYYYEDQSCEIDFVVCNGDTVVKLIQVCYDITSPKTLKRELKAFELAQKDMNCTDCLLVTDHNYGTETLSNGITVNIEPAYRFMVE